MRKGEREPVNQWRVDDDYDVDFRVLYEVINLVSPPGANDLNRDPPPVWWLANPSKEDKVDRRLADLVGPVRQELQKLINAVEGELAVALLELSLFHPDDPKGKHFFSFLLGPEKCLVRYISLINDNVKDRNSQRPLIPNGNLYESPYFTKSYHRSGAASELTDNDAVALVEYFAREEDEADFDTLCKSIKSTFDSVLLKILTTCTPGEDIPRLIAPNFAALIPLLRPAAYHDMEEVKFHEKIRGGGLFLYGERRQAKPRSENGHPNSRSRKQDKGMIFLLKPRHAMLRGIMGVSYSKVDYVRREILAEQSANRANAHEILKFVIAISSQSPPSMLSLIRGYFTFLFPLRTDSVAQQVRSLPFVHCTDLEDATLSLRVIVLAAYDVAGALRATYPLLGNLGSEEAFANFVTESLRNYREALDIADISGHLFSRPLEAKHMWGFFGALVCAFKNTLQHNNFADGKKITISLSQDKTSLVVRNSRLPDDINAIRVPEYPDRGANSLVAFSYYVSRYRKDLVPLTKADSQPNDYFMVDQQDPKFFCTSIPMPESQNANN